ncbi:hypothetical protein ACIBI4_01460 [Streptomyces sp. NPDC050418]|uniref:hypothetical protein n=1 Tax=Streptomyces sp. NPDC050418 TaxID=3365612 RepID=UPI0037A96201
MRRLLRTLPAALLALALTGCGLLGSGGDDGPGTRTAFVELGPLGGRLDQDLQATELGPKGRSDQVYEALEAGEAGALPEARKALAAQPEEGETGLAFVLGGCQETGARLEVEGRKVSAQLTGGENINCAQAEYFLATFTIPTDELPDDWTF